jgi:hypothetical protein
MASRFSDQLASIDNAYDPDPNGTIELQGVTFWSHTIDLWLINTGEGPLVWPGSSFLGRYPAVPLLRSIKEL